MSHARKQCKTYQCKRHWCKHCKPLNLVCRALAQQHLSACCRGGTASRVHQWCRRRRQPRRQLWQCSRPRTASRSERMAVRGSSTVFDTTSMLRQNKISSAHTTWTVTSAGAGGRHCEGACAWPTCHCGACARGRGACAASARSGGSPKSRRSRTSTTAPAAHGSSYLMGCIWNGKKTEGRQLWRGHSTTRPRRTGALQMNGLPVAAVAPSVQSIRAATSKQQPCSTCC